MDSSWRPSAPSRCSSGCIARSTGRWRRRARSPTPAGAAAATAMSTTMRRRSARTPATAKARRMASAETAAVPPPATRVLAAAGPPLGSNAPRVRACGRIGGFLGAGRAPALGDALGPGAQVLGPGLDLVRDADACWRGAAPLDSLAAWRALRLPDDLPRVDGAFAVAWRGDDGAVTLARDPIGERGLLYATTPHGVVFASTMPALLAAGLVPPVLDLPAVPPPARGSAVDLLGLLRRRVSERAGLQLDGGGALRHRAPHHRGARRSRGPPPRSDARPARRSHRRSAHRPQRAAVPRGGRGDGR